MTTSFICKQRVGTNISREVTSISDINANCDFSPFVLAAYKQTCTDPPSATPSFTIQNSATTSAVTFTNPVFEAINGVTWLLWVSLGLIVFAQFVALGLWLFRK